MTDKTNDHVHHHAMHDLGGEDHGPFVITDHDASAFDKDVDALVNLLASKDVALVRPDERRRGIEELSPEIYFGASYYQRWLFGVTRILMEKGLVSESELTAAMAALGTKDKL